MLELAILDQAGKKLADVVFASMQARRGRNIISVRDQNTFDTALRRTAGRDRKNDGVGEGTIDFMINTPSIYGSTRPPSR